MVSPDERFSRAAWGDVGRGTEKMAPGQARAIVTYGDGEVKERRREER